MATARLTIGAVLDTVGSIASTTTQTVNMLSDGVGMMNAAITKAATEQRERHKADAHVFIKLLMKEKAQEIAEMNRQAMSYRRQSDEHAELFDAAYEEMKALFEEKKN